MISIILHGVAAILLGFYMIMQSPKVQELIETTFFEQKKAQQAKPRKPVVKVAPKPVIASEEAIPVKAVAVVPRTVTTGATIRSTVRSATVLQFSNRHVSFDNYVNPNTPKVVVQTSNIPVVTTHADLPISDSPNAIAFEGPVASGTGYGPPIGRGVVGPAVAIANAPSISRAPGLAMVRDVGAKMNVLESIATKIQLGDVAVPALEKGEPGGRIIGRGKDIQGVFRFTRVRHNLSDWWADASSLNALAKWLNERTKIKTDMNVEGGAVKLSDANVMKSPMLFVTGHDPALVRSRNLLRQTGGKLDKTFTETEKVAMRKYLIDKEGLMIFDDCGVNAPAQAMIRLFLAQLRYVMPEYAVERLQSDHEVYNNFYEMGGPPIGFDIFWWGTLPPKRNFLEGISVEEKLAVLVVRRDYMCAMESVSVPTRSVHYSPGVYRFMTNVVVYSLTHGKIADFTGWQPDDLLAKEEFPDQAPQSARTAATPGTK
jgi:hypothetical protein